MKRRIKIQVRGTIIENHPAALHEVILQREKTHMLRFQFEFEGPRLSFAKLIRMIEEKERLQLKLQE